MNKTKDNISLNQIRSIMEILARRQNCCITEIEINPVQSELGRGSYGTVGAFVKQVKQEHINSKAYDRSNISVQLKSAIKEEIDRFADNARENVTEELKAVEGLNNELCSKIDKADEMISALEEAIQAQQAEADKEGRRLNDELVKANEKIDNHKEVVDRQNADLDSCRSELAEKTTEIVAFNRQIGTLEAELKSAQSDATLSSKELAQVINSRNEVEKSAALAEQTAAHQQKTINLLTDQTCKLEQQFNELKTRVSELTTINGQLHHNLDEINRERINDLKAILSQADAETATESVPNKDEKRPETADKRRKTK